jgi:serine-type D-Ala-D-Ala carboxypeptidase/endopeptidase (penicillin-binding protein 4)
MGRMRWTLLVLLLAGLASASGLLHPAPAAAGLSSTITRILKQNDVAGSGTGVCVWNLDAAQLLYARGATTRLAPASNLKLITSASALLNWGPDHRIPTDLYGPDVPVYQGVLYGDVYLKGYGDPSLSTLTYQRHELGITTSSFEGFARSLRKRGVRKIKGSVLGDESWFDTVRTGLAWRSGLQLECGALSALTGDEGLHNGNRVKSPALYAAQLLTQKLKAAGISVTGKPGTGTVPETDKLLKRQFSAPLKKLLKHMNKESDNFFAETLLKGLGKDFAGVGSTRDGLRVVRATLDTLGLPLEDLTLHDGSGLSYQDRVTPEALVQLLFTMGRRAQTPSYMDSLAIAGVDGTLAKRMRGTAAAGNAHAKTGTLNIAECLSGYVYSADGRLVGYSILVNSGFVNWAETTRAEDAIVVALARATVGGKPIQSVAALAWHHRDSPLGDVDAVGSGL